jgi:cytochrome c553
MVQPPSHRCRLWRRLPIAVLAWVAVVSVQAATPSKPARLGLCAACHGETGMAQIPGAPNLAGQKLDYLREALRQYRDGRRNVPLMRAAIGPMSDADLDELARWYSAQTPSVPPTQGNP